MNTPSSVNNLGMVVDESLYGIPHFDEGCKLASRDIKPNTYFYKPNPSTWQTKPNTKRSRALHSNTEPKHQNRLSLSTKSAHKSIQKLIAIYFRTFFEQTIMVDMDAATEVGDGGSEESQSLEVVDKEG